MWWILTALLGSVLIGQCTQLHAYVPVEHDNRDNWLSSGDGDADRTPYEEDFSGSGDPPMIGTPGKSRCQRLRDGQHIPGTYRPICTATGDFAPMQCNHATGECWCVRPLDGREIEGTHTRAPRRPVCWRDVVVTPSPRDDDIYISDSTTVRDVRRHRTSTATSDDDDEETEVRKLPASDLRAFILSEPLFLAGLIGGAVLILLLLILILMFVVYRMRKKDEGSYSLDEPRHSFAYTRAKDQEFFA